MPKIDTNYIKKNVTCFECKSVNLKRTHKQTFISKGDENCQLNNQKINWRQFECKDCQETTNVTSTEDLLLHNGEYAVLPFSVFNYAVEVCDDTVSLFVMYKNSVKGKIIEDDIRDEHIIFFEEFFKSHNLQADNLMENLWSITFDKKHYNFNSFKEGIETITKLIQNTGATYSKSLEECEDSIEDLEFNKENVFY